MVNEKGREAAFTFDISVLLFLLRLMSLYADRPLVLRYLYTRQGSIADRSHRT